MAFLEERMDYRIERGASGGPVNRGRVKVRTMSGKLRQVFGWSLPLHEYDVTHGLRGAADIEALRALWYVVNFAPYEGFRFRDWADFRATQANSTLTLISGDQWQMQRVYAFAGLQFLRPIQKPATGAVVYRTRSGVTSDAAATVATTTGIATISGHVSGDTYTWAGTYDVPVTFADDAWVQRVEAMAADGAIADMPTVKLEEIRL